MINSREQIIASNEEGDEMKWKHRLLSSSLPLEYEVAKILTANGFFVSSDFQFQNVSPAGKGSMDLLAWRQIRPSSPRGEALELFLLVECKYRNPSNSVLFFPQPAPNEKKARAPVLLSCQDRFSFEHVGKSALHDFNSGFSLAMKAAEINTKDHVVSDAELRSGLDQLLHAWICLYCDLINQSLNSGHGFIWSIERISDKLRASGTWERMTKKFKTQKRGLLDRWLETKLESSVVKEPSKPVAYMLGAIIAFSMLMKGRSVVGVDIVRRLTRPFFHCSILTTNSPLFYADASTTLDAIRGMSSLADIAREVDVLGLPVNSDPRLTPIINSSLKTDGKEAKELLEQLERRWSRNFSGGWRANMALAGLKSGAAHDMGDVTVCRLDALDSFLKRILAVVERMSEECTLV